MQFEGSTQSSSWIFDAESLAACRDQALVMDHCRPRGRPKARKFASGFHRSYQNQPKGVRPTTTPQLITPEDQEALVQFHAHQIQSLMGPSALLRELQTSATSLSTAVTFFRRFFLSNSVLSFNPRKMAAACVFFAAKAEDEKIEVGLIAHATAVVQLQVQNAPLCRTELRAVSALDILEYERILMEGLNYEFRCHHPFSAMQTLAVDFRRFLSQQKGLDQFATLMSAEEIVQRAFGFAQRALVFSDVTFLFAPGHIGFAIVAIALGCTLGEEGGIGDNLMLYLNDRFSQKQPAELKCFVSSVNQVIQSLIACPLMDVGFADGVHGSSTVASRRADGTKRVLAKFASVRYQLFHKNPRASIVQSRKRPRAEVELQFTPPRNHLPRKSARVTPVGRHY